MYYREWIPVLIFLSPDQIPDKEFSSCDSFLSYHNFAICALMLLNQELHNCCDFRKLNSRNVLSGFTDSYDQLSHCTHCNWELYHVPPQFTIYGAQQSPQLNSECC